MLTPGKALRYWAYSRPFRKRFGTRHGLRVADAVANAAYRSAAGALVRLSLPGWRDPLWLRTGTTDVDIFRQLVLGNELDLDLDPAPRRIIDGGANIGIASRVFASLWPEAEIVAIELEVENFRTLQKNCEQSPRIVARHAALWDRPGSVRVESTEYGEMGYRAAASSTGAGREQVPALPLEALLDELGWDTLDLIKLDIEGAERQVLSTASQWLGRTRHLVIELHEHFAPGCVSAFEAAVDRRAWLVRAHGEYLVASRLN